MDDDRAVDDHDIDELIACGLYDPGAPDAAERLELLEYLRSLGVSSVELVQADQERRLLSLAALSALRGGTERLTLEEVAARSTVDATIVSRIWSAAGFVEPRPNERRFSERDVELVQFVNAMEGLRDQDGLLQYVRTVSEAMARVAEAQIAMARSGIEAPLVVERNYAEAARTYNAFARDIFPLVVSMLETLLRHHVDVISRRYSDAGAAPTLVNAVPLAVGFADLSGYTDLSRKLDSAHLLALLERFESATAELIVRAGVQVVKRIGDAVMFVTSAPGVACTVALDLVDLACDDPALPSLRVGLAFGEVIVRHGDFYGPVVNLAARLGTAAPPGAILVDDEFACRLGTLQDRFVFTSAGAMALAGFDVPIHASALARPTVRNSTS